MYRPLVLPKLATSRGQHIAPGFSVLATGGPKQGIVPTAVRDIGEYLQAEGWGTRYAGKDLVISYNGTSYQRGEAWLLGRDYSDVPGPLAADILEAVNALGL